MISSSEMCTRPVTTSTAAPATTSSSSSSSSNTPTPAAFIYTELASNVVRYTTGSIAPGSYSNGQDCCDLCAADNDGTRWISYALSTSSEYPECRCKTNNGEPNDGPSYDGTDWARGTCRLPVEFVYSELGTDNRWTSGSSVSGSYSTGQDCCDLCYADDDDTKWISWVRPGTSSPAECRCKTSPSSSEPGLSSSGTGGSDWNRGSCKNKYVFDSTLSGRKKRSATTPWNEVKNEGLMNTKLIERIQQRRHMKRQAPEPVESEEELERRSQILPGQSQETQRKA